MAVSRSHRAPLLLLTLFVGMLLFPRACDEARVELASWLPATVAEEPGRIQRLGAEEAAALRAEVARLEQELASRPSAAGPLGDALPERHRRVTGAVLVAARVIHREISPARRSLLIDVGRELQVVPGLPVVQQDSLIGVVSAASGRSARVLRIDDSSPETAFPAVVLAADAGAGAPVRGEGVARGAGDGRVRVSFLPSDGARVGDLVVTGAGSRLVPEGLLLGEVVECADADRDGAFEALVRPLRDLDAVASVHVVRTPPPGLRVEAR